MFLRMLQKAKTGRKEITQVTQKSVLPQSGGVSHFRVYLYGRRFVFLTNHETLKWLMTNEKLTGMHARWAWHILSGYDSESGHRPGKRSTDAGGLLQHPSPT
jgi:hypothetical protein